MEYDGLKIVYEQAEEKLSGVPVEYYQAQLIMNQYKEGLISLEEMENYISLLILDLLARLSE